MRFRFLALSWPLLMLAAICAGATVEIPGVTSAAPTAASQPAFAPDPLGRENPRGCLIGFIKAAQDEKYEFATQYFQPLTGRRRHSAEDDEEIAAQLLAILNQKFAGPLDFISRDPAGRLDDGLPPDQERVAGVLGANDSFPIQLVRLEDESGRKLWYISRATLDHVPEAFEMLSFPEIEKKIPQS